VTIEAGEIVVWVLVLLRTGTFFLGIPLFAGKLIPVRMRMAFGLILSLLVNPLVPADLSLAEHFAGAILLAMNEVCVGLLLAMMVRMVFFRFHGCYFNKFVLLFQFAYFFCCWSAFRCHACIRFKL
jgi:flagellar biosynthesis protein FliR